MLTNTLERSSILPSQWPEDQTKWSYNVMASNRCKSNKCKTIFVKSTIVAWGMASLVAADLLGSVYLDPIPTNPPRLVESFGKDITLLKSFLGPLSGFMVHEQDKEAIISYLNAQPLAKAFIAGVKPIIERIYHGTTTKKKINIIDDPDTDSPLLEIVILSELPIDADFKQKDQQLFSEIEQAGLSEALEYVVVTQA